MAVSRFVVTPTVTLAADTLATVTAGEPGTGGAAGFGNTATVSLGTSGKYGYFVDHGHGRDRDLRADSSAGSTPPQLLYQRSDRATCARSCPARTTSAEGPATDGTAAVHRGRGRPGSADAHREGALPAGHPVELDDEGVMFPFIADKLREPDPQRDAPGQAAVVLDQVPDRPGGHAAGLRN
jgi:hypothetical protein